MASNLRCRIGSASRVEAATACPVHPFRRVDSRASGRGGDRLLSTTAVRDDPSTPHTPGEAILRAIHSNRSCSSSSARCPASSGSPMSSRGTGTASSSREPTPALSLCSKPAFRASSQPVTSATGRASAATPRWAKERWPCSSSTLGWRWGLRSTDRSLVTDDELRTDTAVVVVGRVAFALAGARMTPATHVSIARCLNRSRRDRPCRKLRDSVTHGQVSGSSSSAAP